MDVLSDVIAVMRRGEPRSALVEWRAPWGQQFRSVPGAAGFQVILRGSCWLIPADGGTPPLQLAVGDVVFLPHGGEHALADSPTTPIAPYICDPQDGGRFEQRYASPPVGLASGDGDQASTVTLCGAYEMDPARVHPLLTDLPEIVHLPARLGHRPEIRSAVELLGAELQSPRLGADAIVPALLDMLLLYILRAWLDEQPGRGETTGWAGALNDPGIGGAIHAIHNEPERAWTVEELGARARMSRASFARRFTALVGRPPLAYLTWWRMTMAARLLTESDAPLGTVAAKVGYGSEFAFANAFKREYGIAPGRYRRGHLPGAIRNGVGSGDQSSKASGGGQEHTRLRSP
ncbi:AraC family transcriptional regulator [Actinomadura barringtoniae]|uniref:AraC family transcriptional regulator n=1 Tax=Actinomadura barringtoniae TaxID=1427535 RepID=A0A939TC01_9ACTN|nr:AraC family transcriptional regulator [Actinomadura barringtoniae]MBO2454057.1 AraC family transcriptional regulator [Actinomadura barringtoniae]